MNIFNSMCKIVPRIKILAEREQITIGALERVIGASKGVLSRAINNGTDIQSKWLEAIVENYPHYSAQWLLTGKGEMLLSQKRTQKLVDDELNEEHHYDNDSDIMICCDGASTHDRRITSSKSETRPRIPYDAAAGTLSFAIDTIKDSQCERLPLIPTFPKYDFTIIARGDSMMPDFMSGDELACAFVSEKSFIQWGRVHILDTAQGVVLKRIFDLKDSILCKSINRDYPDFYIPKDEIYHIAIVVGLIRHL